MKDKAKTAFKRLTSGLMALLLAVCLVGTPKAKAVVTEGAMLGSIFGSLLVSMGFSWAAENMDVPTFGEAMYKLIQEHDDANKDTGVQLIRDLNIAALTSGRPGTIQFNYAWTQAARSFAEWFQENYLSTSDSAVVSSNNGGLLLADGSVFELTIWDGVYDHQPSFVGSKISRESGRVVFSTGAYFNISDTYSLEFYYPDGTKYGGSAGVSSNEYIFLYRSGDSILTGYKRLDWSGWNALWAGLDLSPYLTISPASSLTAEKPAEVHYPEVAEDGSQVYEVTYEGVTATDIEGIVQGAVDRILAGTASIVGSVEQVGTVVNPEIDPYKVALTSVFPFCIPFDIYNMVTMFVAEPEAPQAEWTFELPWSSQEYSVGWDLSDFDGVAQVCRSMQLVLFAVGLAVITHKVIKW